MNKSKELVTNLVDEELLLEEVKVGWVLLQGLHDLVHFGSPNLKKGAAYFRLCTWAVYVTLFILHRVRAGKGISQMGTGVLKNDQIKASFHPQSHPPIKADKNRTCDRLIDDSVDQISSDHKGTSARQRPKNPLAVRSEKS